MVRMMPKKTKDEAQIAQQIFVGGYNAPAEVYSYTLDTGLKKTNLAISQTLALSFLAGTYIALAGVGSMVASYAITNASIASLVSGFVFATGLMMVVIAGGELFTGNVLIGADLMQGKVTMRAYIKNLLLVLGGNFLGALFIAILTHYIGLPGKADAQLALALVTKASSKLHYNFGISFVSGVLCNMLVALAVWMSYAAKDIAGKVLACLFPIMLFIIAGFEHVVANCYYLPAAYLAAREPAWQAVTGLIGQDILASGFGGMIQNLIPVALGNIAGGFVLIICYQQAYKKI